MYKLKLENFKPVETLEDNFATGGWEISYEEGVYFKAFCKSKDGKVTCTYKLTAECEKLLVEAVDPYAFRRNSEILKKIKPMVNNGNGIVTLSGGYVSKRFGFFRKKDFQDFLDKHALTSVRNFMNYGFWTTFVIEDDHLKKNRIILPKKTKLQILNRNLLYHNMESACSIESKNEHDTKIVSVYDCDFFIYEEATARGVTRKLYVHGNKVNAMMYDNELSLLLKSLHPLELNVA